jgi:hypothetical protein
VQNFVFDGAQQDLELLRFGADTRGTQVGMAGDGTVQRSLLLTVCRVGDRQTLVTPFCLHGGHVEYEISLTYAGTSPATNQRTALLSSRVAHSTHLRDIIKEK